MKRPLRYIDIKKDGKYKVVFIPPHWDKNIFFWPLGKVGIAKWINPMSGVNLVIQGQERLIKPELLEEVKEETEVGNKVTMNLNASVVAVGDRCKVVKVPHFWDEVDHGPYPILNKIVRVKRVLADGCLMYSGDNESNQHYLPYECIESAGPVVEIEDSYLVKQILRNPKGTLKLIKGLAKMNKDIFCRAFVERGTI